MAEKKWQGLKNMIKPKKILITGGAGFIGSHLCEVLLEKNYEIFCFDNLFTGKKENIKALLKNKNFHFYKFDVINPIPEELLPKNLYGVFHLASPAGPNPAAPKSYLQFPIETYLVNSIGTHNLCQLALEKNAVFLFASTSEVYGDPEQHPQKETYKGNVNTLGERSCYDESKRFGEMVTSVFQRKFSLDTRIIRIFNTYGPRMNPEDGRVLPIFILQALANKPITIFGDGKQTRGFCFIDDLVKGIVKVFEKGKSDEAYNLGNPREITIIETAKLVKKLTKSKSSFVFKNLPEDDPKKRCPDIEKAQKQLSWQPEVSLMEGLKKMISWFKNQRR